MEGKAPRRIKSQFSSLAEWGEWMNIDGVVAFLQ